MVMTKSQYVTIFCAFYLPFFVFILLKVYGLALYLRANYRGGNGNPAQGLEQLQLVARSPTRMVHSAL